MTKLTVGLPVYNAMPFLPSTVDSLLRQTFGDFDLFVIDDGSTDDSLAYLQSVRDSRLRLLARSNQGLSATLNQMLRETSGPWLVRHDADDIAYPDRLGHVVAAIERFPEAGMFYTLADYVGAGPGRRSYRTTVAGPDVLRAITRAGYLLGICHPTVVLNVAKTLALGGYRTDLRSAQDIELWWRMALRHDIRLIPERTLAYRLTASGLSSSGLLEQSTEVMFAQYLLLSELWRLPPQPFEAVRSRLAEIIDMKLFRHRAHVRSSAIAFEQSRLLQSALHAIGAAWTAPGYLMERIRHESPRHQALAVNGVNPLRYASRVGELWPGAAG